MDARILHVVWHLPEIQHFVQFSPQPSISPSVGLSFEFWLQHHQAGWALRPIHQRSRQRFSQNKANYPVSLTGCATNRKWYFCLDFLEDSVDRANLGVKFAKRNDIWNISNNFSPFQFNLTTGCETGGSLGGRSLITLWSLTLPLYNCCCCCWWWLELLELFDKNC